MAIQDKTGEPAQPRRDLTQTAFAAGGLLAAFGVASCCALPVALSLIGISAASLVGIGYVAAQYQRELFYVAVVLTAAAAFLMWRQRQALACGPGAACARPVLDWGSRIAVFLTVALMGLTFWIEPPL